MNLNAYCMRICFFRGCLDKWLKSGSTFGFEQNWRMRFHCCKRRQTLRSLKSIEILKSNLLQSTETIPVMMGDFFCLKSCTIIPARTEEEGRPTTVPRPPKNQDIIISRRDVELTYPRNFVLYRNSIFPQLSLRPTQSTVRHLVRLSRIQAPDGKQFYDLLARVNPAVWPKTHFPLRHWFLGHLVAKVRPPAPPSGDGVVPTFLTRWCGNSPGGIPTL